MTRRNTNKSLPQPLEQEHETPQLTTRPLSLRTRQLDAEAPSLEVQTDESQQERRERAARTARWLKTVLETMSYTDIFISWQQQGLDAPVLVHGVDAGTLQEVWERFRTQQYDDFRGWLRSLLTWHAPYAAVHPRLAPYAAALPKSVTQLAHELERFLTTPTPQDVLDVRLNSLRLTLRSLMHTLSRTDRMLERLEQQYQRHGDA